MLDLAPSYRQQVLDLVHQHAPQAAIYAFGSRTQGVAKPFSDLDLLLDPPLPMSWAQRASLRMAFEESDLPMRVDWQLWQDAPEHLRAAAREANVALTPV